MHLPVLQQGVARSKRCALMGAATFLARFSAESTSGQTLFMPTTKTTFFGPCAIAETRFELPSILTKIPSDVMALQLDRNTSASYAASMAARLSSYASLSIKLYLSVFNASERPISCTLIAPPMEIELPSGISSSAFFNASSLFPA